MNYILSLERFFVLLSHCANGVWSRKALLFRALNSFPLFPHSSTETPPNSNRSCSHGCWGGWVGPCSILYYDSVMLIMSGYCHVCFSCFCVGVMPKMVNTSFDATKHETFILHVMHSWEVPRSPKGITFTICTATGTR